MSTWQPPTGERLLQPHLPSCAAGGLNLLVCLGLHPDGLALGDLDKATVREGLEGRVVLAPALQERFLVYAGFGTNELARLGVEVERLAEIVPGVLPVLAHCGIAEADAVAGEDRLALALAGLEHLCLVLDDVRLHARHEAGNAVFKLLDSGAVFVVQLLVRFLQRNLLRLALDLQAGELVDELFAFSAPSDGRVLDSSCCHDLAFL